MCTTMVAAGVLTLLHPPRPPALALRASSSELVPPSARNLSSRSEAQVGVVPGGAGVSLADLVREARAGTAASTTTPPATSGAKAKVTTTTAALAPTSTTTRPGAPGGATAPATSATTATLVPPIPLTPLTTLLQKVVPTTVVASNRTETGVASWFHAPDGTCAHRDAPMGTVIKVTRSATGATTTCRVNDRGPAIGTNRLIDLSLDTFEKLASQDAGLIDVRIEW